MTEWVQVEKSRLIELERKARIFDAWIREEGAHFLLELAAEQGIDAPSMLNIADTAADLAQREHEEKPISSAFIVGEPARIADLLPEAEIHLVEAAHIREMSRVLTTLAEMVDGQVLAYAIDQTGLVHSIRKVDIHLDDEQVSPILGAQFRRYAIISKQAHAVVFFVPPQGHRVKVFAHGALVGEFVRGDWVMRDAPHIDRSVTAIAQGQHYDLALVQRVLSVAFQMSEMNLGAIFMVGDADDILNRSDPPKISAYAAIQSANIYALSDQELINFAKQDGATIVDARGAFKGCMVLLRPQPHTVADTLPGEGARHTSAAKMSAETGSMAVVVSQDGPISIYQGGKLILRL
ncbi:MAG: DNA integrity scanning protein DisA nucleotide-binding domain protein [Chloroflexi bacterium]|nr:DNA integrity scanning protein DisA nucleotide-binding domain protein [Chloroflexota bacterium]MBU1747740.1 DNA integrity scanning protein DisA nucleotide-binding domain protein [Chloroflexota bacterium]MBU1878991.1 DNA integrity scanning protein DisA nucleotide-binding domain protein [Chloroflexota bacterium]